MTVHCRICGRSDFRAARFRERDLPHLLLLQYPVRCRTCSERSYTSILRIFKIKREARIRRESENRT